MKYEDYSPKLDVPNNNQNKTMNKKYLSEKHAALVAKRSGIIDTAKKTYNVDFLDDDTKKTLKELDWAIGRLAAVFNDKCSAKARKWLEEA